MICLCWLNLRFGYTTFADDWSFLILSGQIQADNGLFLTISQPSYATSLLGSFTEIFWFPVCGNKQGVIAYTPMCQFTDIKNIMISQLGQFAENYGETFATIYRDFIDHSLFCNGRFTTTMYKYSKRITRILWKSKGYMSYRDFVNLQIYGSPLIQFRKIYNPPFRSMYRKLWCPICY